MRNIVPMKWLLARLYEPDVVIVDCRFNLANPEQGRQDYAMDRIPGAVYFDLNRDLSSEVLVHGGRHPLPDKQTFIETVQRAGISPTSRIIAYDDQAGAMASRYWWLMKWIGHEQVSVLQQPYQQWKRSQFPIETSKPAIRIPSQYPVTNVGMSVVEMDDVKRLKRLQNVTLLDSRELNRYLGFEEPIDRVAGHIPNAIQMFWREGMGEAGEWETVEVQQARFSAIPKNNHIIVYCGSGVTACPNILALMEAGYKNVSLYAGSWSDWISYPDNPIATKQ
jgi:thiosulfate/3-mercaptopyruvate sulfurtransferase